MNEAVGTQPAIVSQQPALLAGQILKAVRKGSLAELETGLERAEHLAATSAAPRQCFNEEFEEKLELLEAVADDMRHSIARYGRSITPRLEGIEVHVQLLRHLAGANAGGCPIPSQR
jgi:hypothetical protein